MKANRREMKRVEAKQEDLIREQNDTKINEQTRFESKER